MRVMRENIDPSYGLCHDWFNVAELRRAVLGIDRMPLASAASLFLVRSVIQVQLHIRGSLNPALVCRSLA